MAVYILMASQKKKNWSSQKGVRVQGVVVIHHVARWDKLVYKAEKNILWLYLTLLNHIYPSYPK